MEILPTTRGKHKIGYQGYMYTKQISKVSHVRWRCVQRNNGCKGTMTTSLDLTQPELGNSHNHAPDPAAISIAKFLDPMKKKRVQQRRNPARYTEIVWNICHPKKGLLIKRNLRGIRELFKTTGPRVSY
ncbi:FLYWCH-type zinc finger-containing protein 1 [Biomphalaria glabrata]|nr:FLYWCH-type zinc finger-containing protein 1 [Biomphalaria glabrata]